MKNARILLSVLTVTAVAGGILAFKVKNKNCFAYPDPASGLCSLNSFFTFETTLNGVVAKPYNECFKPARMVNGMLTCTTLITIAP